MSNVPPGWLPPLVLFEDSKGRWEIYEQVLYKWFRTDFVDSKPRFPGKRVGLKRHPVSKGKEATFWHFISEGPAEGDRLPDLRRCERIRWPKPLMESFPGDHLRSDGRTVWWRSERGGENRYLLALLDYSYVFVLADRGEYVLPWTAFCVEPEHRRKKLAKECEEYWRAQNG